jgi:hypothetical protein
MQGVYGFDFNARLSCCHSTRENALCISAAHPHFLLLARSFTLCQRVGVHRVVPRLQTTGTSERDGAPTHKETHTIKSIFMAAMN